MIKTKNIRRRNYRNLVIFGLGVFVAVFLFVFLAQRFGKIEDSTSAANLANFNAGYIISDYQMTQYDSMSEMDIQNFLWAKGRCYNTNFNGVGTRVDYFSDYTPPTTWHVRNGHTVCLAEENVNGESAAHVIWQAAQDYRINPKVLLVLIQKETGLITDPIPNSWDYQRTAGYGCPDTAACSEKYYGFKNQIRNAAYLFRVVMDGNSSYYPIGYNNIRYSPNPDCGSSMVYIQNLATSALYRYTPYQPNAGALAAGYGTAYCGAYGNRNFFAYFQDWFGGITDEKPALTIEGVRANMPKVAAERNELSFKYNVNVAELGWMDPPVNGGEMTGTTGYGLRMEALSIALEDTKGIEYRSHIQDIGWESEFKKDGEVSGTIGRNLRIEAVQIKLNEQLSKNYDIYYRVHVADIGWMDWVKNGEMAGTTGQSKQMEAIQIKIVKKETGLNFKAHVADIGWMDWVQDNRMAGTTGQSRRMEAIIINFDGKNKEDIQYRVHAADIGWMDWVGNNEMAGTTGQSRRIEAIEIKLSDELINYYDIYYRVHVADIGWMDWVKNGEMAGTTGQSKQMEAIEILVLAK
ncbi:hypothetical protein IJI18_01570 [Candidatus Saccharibacteria bacterium]|nr:hypothetical protein [Candidatus Saccharibacteria bacterium]